MKRIKLFEAFTNSVVIQKIDHLLLCWCVSKFIKDSCFFPKLKTGTIIGDIFSLYDVYGKDYYFTYFRQESALGNDVRIYCDLSLKDYVIDKKIDIPYYKMPDNLQKAVNHVVKKLYEDEKNKTI